MSNNSLVLCNKRSLLKVSYIDKHYERLPYSDITAIQLPPCFRVLEVNLNLLLFYIFYIISVHLAYITSFIYGSRKTYFSYVAEITTAMHYVPQNIWFVCEISDF